MKDILEEIVECLGKRESVVLATIVSSDGSSPLPSGSMMLVKSSSGDIAGTVGGGLLEALVIEEAKKYFTENLAPKVGTFDLNDDVSNEGMICGGSVDVLLEPLGKTDSGAFETLLKDRREGADCILLRMLIGPERTVKRFILSNLREAIPETIRSSSAIGGDVLSDAIRHSFGKEDVRRIKADSGEIIIQPIHGLQDLIIFGGGHVSKHLAQVASIAGFTTTVIDDRQEFADPGRFPGAEIVIVSEYENAFAAVEVKPSTFIVILTRGHQFDELVLEHAIRTPARYIGMIGSKRKVIATFKNLMERGVTAAQLKKVRAPIGLEIGAVTAEEIAVSILAEMITVRRDVRDTFKPISAELSQWFDAGAGKR